MAGLFGLFSGAAERASRPFYSIEHLQQLYNKLQLLKNAEEQNRDIMVEVIRQITEALIWGEQNGHDHNFFDFFCEKNILADFVHILSIPRVAKTVKVQLLQTLSILVQNIRRDTSLYYLFSNNYVNQLISTQFDWSDEEILGYYISFLKSLALRLNEETIKFFFNERAEQFPLYIEAIRFFGHREQMVRTSVRTVTLQVYSIGDEAMQRFVLDRSSPTYFRHLACHLRMLWTALDTAAERAASGGHSEQAVAFVQDANEQQKDVLMYISDVLDLEMPALSEALAERILKDALFPVLLGSILAGAWTPVSGGTTNSEVASDSPDSGSAASAAPSLLHPTCALYILHQVFDTCRSRYLLQPLATAVLGMTVPVEVLQHCLHPPPPPPPTYRATTADVSGPASNEVIVQLGPEFEVPNGTSDAALQQPVSARRRLLAWLEDSSDACILLVAGIFHRFLTCRTVLPESVLIETGLVQGRRAVADAEDGSCEEQHTKVLVLIVQALERSHASLRTVVVQALIQMVLDLIAEPAFRCSHEWRAPTLAAARSAEKSAARHVSKFLHNDGGILHKAACDAFLDVFIEEWEELQRAPTSISVREACSNIRCLFPPALGAGLLGVPPQWSLPASHSERQHAAKAVCSLLSIRRLQSELPPRAAVATPPTPPPLPAFPGGLPAGEPDGTGILLGPALRPATGFGDECSLTIPEEAVDGYREGKSFEVGRQDRIVCGVVTPEGRHTRYLVLHPFQLMLVQPDLVSPGFAVVRTLAPVRRVEPCIDRTDPRTLRLSIRLARGAPCPGEACPYDPSKADTSFRLPPEEHRGSSFFMLIISFEDVKRCHCADYHLRRRRQEVRSQLSSRLEAFVDALAT